MKLLQILKRLFLVGTAAITLSFFFGVTFLYHYISSTPSCKALQSLPQKILIVTGELSGERLGVWYLNKLKKENPHLVCHVIGGYLFSHQEVQLHPEFDELRSGLLASTSNGISDYIKTIPHQYHLFNELVDFIIVQQFDHVILIDLPIINLPLARKLKQKKPTLYLTYIAPPELWFWGNWGRDRLLKNTIDKIIVLYPFEQAWYQSIGLDVEWQGYPFIEEFNTFINTHISKEKMIALLPGSRKNELVVMLPILSEFVTQFKKKYPDISFILPLAESFSLTFMQEQLARYKLTEHIIIIQGEEKKKMLSRCCFAITKPGTITLELALLKCPMIITYKVPWFNYLLMKFIIQPKFVGLPNLFASQEICKELLQSECTTTLLLQEAFSLYEAFLSNGSKYQQQYANLELLCHTFTTEQNDHPAEMSKAYA